MGSYLLIRQGKTRGTSNSAGDWRHQTDASLSRFPCPETEVFRLHRIKIRASRRAERLSVISYQLSLIMASTLAFHCQARVSQTRR
jgi:hypothetical protein